MLHVGIVVLQLYFASVVVAAFVLASTYRRLRKSGEIQEAPWHNVALVATSFAWPALIVVAVRRREWGLIRRPRDLVTLTVGRRQPARSSNRGGTRREGSQRWRGAVVTLALSCLGIVLMLVLDLDPRFIVLVAIGPLGVLVWVQWFRERRNSDASER